MWIIIAVILAVITLAALIHNNTLQTRVNELDYRCNALLEMYMNRLKDDDAPVTKVLEDIENLK